MLVITYDIILSMITLAIISPYGGVFIMFFFLFIISFLGRFLSSFSFFECFISFLVSLLTFFYIKSIKSLLALVYF